MKRLKTAVTILTALVMATPVFASIPNSVIIGNKAYDIKFIFNKSNYHSMNEEIKNLPNQTQIYYKLDPQTKGKIFNVFTNEPLSDEQVRNLPQIEYTDINGFTTIYGEGDSDPIEFSIFVDVIQGADSMSDVKNITVKETNIQGAKYFNLKTEDGIITTTIGNSLSTVTSSTYLPLTITSDDGHVLFKTDLDVSKNISNEKILGKVINSDEIIDPEAVNTDTYKIINDFSVDESVYGDTYQGFKWSSVNDIKYINIQKLKDDGITWTNVDMETLSTDSVSGVVYGISPNVDYQFRLKTDKGISNTINFTKKEIIVDPRIKLTGNFTNGIIGQNGKLYYLDEEAKTLYIMNLESKQIDKLELQYPCENLSESNGKLYITQLKHPFDFYLPEDKQGGAVTIVDEETMQKIDTINLDIDPYSINVDGDILYITSGSGQWTKINSYSISTNQVISSSSIRVKSSAKLNINKGKIYTLTSDTSPRYFTVFSVNNGEFLEPKYPGGYSISGLDNLSENFYMSPDGEYILNGNGQLLKCEKENKDDLKPIFKMSKEAKTALFDSVTNVVYAYTGNNQIYSYDLNSMKPLKTIDSSADCIGLFISNGKLLAVEKQDENVVLEFLDDKNKYDITK